MAGSRTEDPFARAEPDVAGDGKKVVTGPCFEITAATYTSMLDVRFKTRDCHGLPYSYLTEIAYNPSVGITLHFSAKVVRIKGRNLDLLYAYLLQHRVVFVQELDDPRRVKVPDGLAIITAIAVEEPREPEEVR